MVRISEADSKAIHHPRHTGKVALIAGALIIFLRVFAYQLFPEAVANSMFFLGILFLLAYCFVNRRNFLKQHVRCLLWVVPSVCILANCILLGKPTWSLALLLLAVLALVVFSSSTDWIGPFYFVLVSVLAVFAIATVVLFLFPDLYPPIKAAFFIGYHGATGYQSGLTTHYSINGSLAALGFVLSACGLLFGNKDGMAKKFWLLVVLLFFGALLLTAKRGPLLSAAIAIFLAFFVSDSKGKLSKFVLTATVVMCGILVLATFIPQIGEVFDRFAIIVDNGTLEEATSGRTNIWALAVADWCANPVFGIGWGRFVYTYPSGTLSVSLAHNELLHTLATVGVVGSLFLVVAEIYSLFFTLKIVKGVSSDCPFRIYLYASFAVQILTLFYGYTSGGIVELEYIVVPYLFAIAIVFSIANCVSPQSSHLRGRYHVM